MNILRGGIAPMLDRETVKIDWLGKWIAFQISNRGKRVIVTMIYRIP